MKNKFIAAIAMLCSALCAFGSAKSIYFVGGFNNWDINHPVVVSEADGLFETIIDFSSNDSFKLSTVNPEGSWNKFDEGTLFPSTNTKEDEWTDIEVRQTSPNIIAPAKREYCVKVDLDNMKILFSTGGSVKQPWSGTLPVMFITTENKAPIESKEKYLAGTYWLDPMGVEGIESIGSAEAPLALQIKGRGNYTWWGFQKKPYRIKLDKKAALTGMDKSKHFALLAHADDSAAGLRNALGFAASETLLMPWTPATAPIEVVLNGDYIGLYWLTETIRVDSDRVDIEEQADLATENVDGGWLVEIDNYDSDPHITVKDSSGNPIWFTYKSPEELSARQEQYLLGAMQGIQDAVSSGNQSEAARLVDFGILARYFIVNQLMLDMESFHGSCYLYRQRGSAEKWNFGPVWDFGNSFNPQRADKPRFIFDKPDFSQVWIGEFYRMPSFVNAVKTVWAEFLNNGPEALSESLDYRAGQIAAAAICDAKRWPEYAHTDIEQQRDRLQRYLNGSIEWLKEQWGDRASVAPIAAPSLNIRGGKELIVIDTSESREVVVACIDGRSITAHLSPGINHITIPAGIYIIEGLKVAVTK